MWIIILALILLFVWLVREGGRGRYDYDQDRRAAPTPKQRAIDLLNERYAKGEIGKDEYEQKKKDILS